LACEPNLTFVPSLAYKTNSTVVPSLACKTSSTFVPSSDLVSSSNDDSEDENPPPHAHLPPYDSFELELAPAPPLPRWVCSTREEVGDLVGDPSDHYQTHSHIQ
jgi:hypothetical protein